MTTPSPIRSSSQDDLPDDVRRVGALLDRLAAHEREAAPEGLEESIFLSLSLADCGREAMAAAPANLEDRIFAATRGELTAARAVEQPPRLKLVGEGELPSGTMSRADVRRVLESPTHAAWWNRTWVRAAAVVAIVCVPAATVWMSMRTTTTTGGTGDIAGNGGNGRTATSDTAVLVASIDQDVDTLMTVFDDALPSGSASSTPSDTPTDGAAETLDDDWFGMAEFLSEDAL